VTLAVNGIEVTPRQQASLEALWPLADQRHHFDLGHVLNCAVTDAIEPPTVGALATHHAGLWACDLPTNRLVWSGGVYDLFGLERGTPLTREGALRHYCDWSLARLERLRSHALAHGQGFTIDVDIRAASVGELRRLRIIGAPSSTGLHGIKLLI
jgi:hypothetical protein